MAADDLALLAHRLDRRSYLHDPFRRLGSGDPALAAVAAAATESWICPRARRRPRTRAGHRMVATPRSAARGPPSRSPAPTPALRPALASGAPERSLGRQMPRREDPRPVGGDRDGELEVRGRRAVLGEDRPAVARRRARPGARRSSSARPRAPCPPPAAGPCRACRSWAPAGPRACCARRRGRRASARPTARRPRRPAGSRCETSPMRLPARHCSTPACSASLGRARAGSAATRVDLAHGERARGVGDPAVERHADVDRDDVAALQAVAARGCRARPSRWARRRSSRGSRGSP